VHGTRFAIVNDRPIVGNYNVNNEGSGDMYYKGGNMLNMMRTITNDDEKWRGILRGLNKTFYHQTVTYDDVVNYITDQSGKNLKPVFEQYLKYKSIPILNFMETGGKLYVRWISDVKGFNMPVRVKLKGGEYQFITPSTRFMPVTIEGAKKNNIEVDTFNYYIGVMMD